MPYADTARKLASTIEPRRAEIERGRRLPPDLVAQLAGAGLFNLCVPRAYGGGEIEPADLVETIEAVARADGSTGWCVMIGATSGMVAAYLPDDEARAIYRSSDVVTGGVFAPRGTATPVEGGFRMNGRWAFASGSQHCAWLMGGCLVGGADGARGGDGAPDGAPDARLLLLPTGEVEILDTWTVAGLCGTGSHDMVVTDAFVPAGRAVSLVTEPPRQRGALYAFPLFGLLALGIAAVALGLGRAAVDELTDLAGVKVPTGSRRRLAQRSAVQADVARAEARLRSGRAFLLDAVGAAWASACAGDDISLEQRALLRTAATHATREAAATVDLAYEAGGGSSIYASSPLQRHFRDVHVVTQHVMVAPATYELTGRVLLGIPTDTTML
ncbi:MAG: flavin-dependent monooxygenase [Actinobacteria bacterium]|nr:MAG: flavin-dependent monooxygenase [Actinomycetota bacterium]